MNSIRPLAEQAVHATASIAYDLSTAAAVRVCESTIVQGTALRILSALRLIQAAFQRREAAPNYLVTNCSVEALQAGENPYEWLLVHGSTVPIA